MNGPQLLPPGLAGQPAIVATLIPRFWCDLPCVNGPGGHWLQDTCATPHHRKDHQ